MRRTKIRAFATLRGNYIESVMWSNETGTAFVTRNNMTRFFRYTLYSGNWQDYPKVHIIGVGIGYMTVRGAIRAGKKVRESNG